MVTGRSVYEHVIVGAGLSGLLLARGLLDGPLSSAAEGPAGRRLLLVDPQRTLRHRVTLAHWAGAPTLLDRWALRSWDHLLVVGHDGRRTRMTPAGYRYTALDWQAARAALLDDIVNDPRVRFLDEPAEAVRDGPQFAAVRVAGAWMRGRWVYDSRPPQTGTPGRRGRGGRDRRALDLHQTFRGVWVRADGPSIDPVAATLLDFSADDSQELGFAYVLPIDARSAMVMAVRMGASLSLPDPLPAARRVLGDGGWQVVGAERGSTVLSTPAADRRQGRRVLAIGARGGRVRPSTGYAVTRILADTEAVLASLQRHGHPFAVPPDPWRSRVLDAVWLHALARERADLEPAFLALFSRIPVDTALRFLDGRASAMEVGRVIAALPPRPFLVAAARLALSLPAGGQRFTSGAPHP